MRLKTSLGPFRHPFRLCITVVSECRFCIFEKLLMVYVSWCEMQNAKRENGDQKQIGFHDRNGGPNGHFAPKAVLKPFKNIGREHGVGRVAQNVCLPVVYQCFRGAQNAL